VCTHIERYLQLKDGGSSNHTQSAMEKIGENNQKVGKIC
jgi:hypothetical protein